MSNYHKKHFFNNICNQIDEKIYENFIMFFKPNYKNKYWMHSNCIDSPIKDNFFFFVQSEWNIKSSIKRLNHFSIENAEEIDIKEIFVHLFIIRDFVDELLEAFNKKNKQTNNKNIIWMFNNKEINNHNEKNGFKDEDLLSFLRSIIFAHSFNTNKRQRRYFLNSDDVAFLRFVKRNDIDFYSDYDLIIEIGVMNKNKISSPRFIDIFIRFDSLLGHIKEYFEKNIIEISQFLDIWFNDHLENQFNKLLNGKEYPNNSDEKIILLKDFINKHQNEYTDMIREILNLYNFKINNNYLLNTEQLLNIDKYKEHIRFHLVSIFDHMIAVFEDCLDEFEIIQFITNKYNNCINHYLFCENDKIKYLIEKIFTNLELNNSINYNSILDDISSYEYKAIYNSNEAAICCLKYFCKNIANKYVLIDLEKMDKEEILFLCKVSLYCDNLKRYSNA